MKKLLAVVLLSGFLVAGQAQAGTDEPLFSQIGPYCIYLTNFCDRLEVSVSPDEEGELDLVHGLWDWTCAGTPLAWVAGPLTGCNEPRPEPGESARQLDAVLATFIPELGYTIFFDFDLVPGPSGFTFELWGFDGFNPPFAFQLEQPFTYQTGPCGFSAQIDKTKPSLMEEILKVAPRKLGNPEVNE